MSDKQLKVDADVFFRRIRQLAKLLNNEKINVALFVNGNDSGSYNKTLSIHHWLFGYNIPNSAFFLHNKKLTIVASKKVHVFLKPAMNDKEIQIDYIEKVKGEDEKENCLKFRQHLENIPNVKTVGRLPKDSFEGKFFESFSTMIKDLKYDFVDLSQSLSGLLSIKDEMEILKVKKAGDITAKMFAGELKEDILKVVDEGTRTAHKTLADKTEKKVEKLASDAEVVETCYAPIIQSGGKYSLKFTIESDEINLHSGVIICSMGIRYDFYCSNIIRTIMINSTAEQKKLYEYLVDDLYVFAMNEMQPGRQFGDVSKCIQKKFANDKPQLSGKLLTTFGFSTGVEFKDKLLQLSNNSTAIFRKDMTIIFYIGLENLENPEGVDKKSKVYSIWIGDTILIGGADGKGENPEVEIGGNLILTGAAKRRNKHYLFQLKDDNNDDVNFSKPLVDLENYGRGQRRAAVQQQKKEDIANEEKRKEHQTQLFKKMLADCEKRLMGIKSTEDNVQRKKNYISYKSRSSLPKDESIMQSHLFIDKRSHSVLLYPNGSIVPFHMSIIKNASFTEEGDKSYLRFNFNAQGYNTLGKTALDENTEDIYLKELTIKTSNLRISPATYNLSAMLHHTYQSFKEEQRRYKAEACQAQENANLVAQDTLISNPRKEMPKLKDLFIRPTISKQRITGNLECHSNGLRFASLKGENIDILFNNIKNAFFQPCDKEMIVLIHFHLKNPIMYSKKKQKDIQFYTEVGELTTDLGKYNHMNDRDDIAAEQREKEMRKKVNEAFLKFCTKVQEISQERIDFDQPFRKLGFNGCPFRSTVFLQPTTSCLVQLTEWPPFVVNMDEIELVFFERVNMSNKSCDMVMIYKDYNEKPVTIQSLPQDKLDDVKNWLDHIEIYFSEGGKSLNWQKIMKNITDDAKKFLEDGGWEALCGESDAEEEDEDMEEDEVYNPTNSDENDGSDSESEDGDDDSNWEGEDDSGPDGELDSDESEGMSWDDLEERARKEDAAKDFNDPPPTKKRKH